MHKKLFKRAFAMVVSLAFLLNSMPRIGPQVMVVANVKSSNRWDNSDIRWYLNTGARDAKGDTFDDSTIQEHNTNARGYASHFSATEYGLVQASTVSTNVFVNNSQTGTIDTYTTTDKFFLPSGNYSSDKVLSWGSADISADGTYGNETTDSSGKKRLIPISYWAYCGTDDYGWQRSPHYGGDGNALLSGRGNYVNNNNVNNDNAVAATFRVNLSSVIFASAASAAHLAAEGGAKKIKISGSEIFGKNSTDTLPSYGMYLKTTAGADVTFTPTALSLSDDKKTLTVTYTGGVPGQYVVVHAFTADNLTAATASYAAAAKLTSTGGAAGVTATINVSAWDLTSVDGLTFKVWMEDPGSGVNLAKAAEPATFSSRNVDKAQPSTMLPIDLAADAPDEMKNELKCSWGDLSALTNKSTKQLDANGNEVESDGTATEKTDFEWICEGKTAGGNYAADTTVKGKIAGVGAPNQKIYFGDYEVTENATTVRKPMEFWIAGREYGSGVVTTDGTGDTMCLYQATAVDTRAFKRTSEIEPAYQNALTVSGLNTTYSCSDAAQGTTVTLSTTQNATVVTPTYTSSNPHVATVNATTGAVTVNNPGTFEVIVTKAAGTSPPATYAEFARAAVVRVSDYSWDGYEVSQESGEHMISWVLLKTNIYCKMNTWIKRLNARNVGAKNK